MRLLKISSDYRDRFWYMLYIFHVSLSFEQKLLSVVEMSKIMICQRKIIKEGKINKDMKEGSFKLKEKRVK